MKMNKKEKLIFKLLLLIWISLHEEKVSTYWGNDLHKHCLKHIKISVQPWDYISYLPSLIWKICMEIFITNLYLMLLNHGEPKSMSVLWYPRSGLNKLLVILFPTDLFLWIQSSNRSLCWNNLQLMTIRVKRKGQMMSLWWHCSININNTRSPFTLWHYDAADIRVWMGKNRLQLNPSKMKFWLPKPREYFIFDSR